MGESKVHAIHVCSYQRSRTSQRGLHLHNFKMFNVEHYVFKWNIWKIKWVLPWEVRHFRQKKKEKILTPSVGRAACPQDVFASCHIHAQRSGEACHGSAGLQSKGVRGTRRRVEADPDSARPTASQRVVLIVQDNLCGCDFRFLWFSVIHTRGFYYTLKSWIVFPGWSTKNMAAWICCNK